EKLRKFYDYLSRRVNILRVSVPSDTDLNHYFEIMNTRGEQLEKHEILKAKLMHVLRDEKRSCYAFNKVWEACSDMERYVQYGFSTTERDSIFTAKNWNYLTVGSFDELLDKIEYKEDVSNSTYLDLVDIVSHPGNFDHNDDHKEEAPERFTSIVNFQNFLLHILRVQTEQNVSLDDKRLLESFDDYLNVLNDRNAKINFVKLFAFNLLKGKFLF